VTVEKSFSKVEKDSPEKISVDAHTEASAAPPNSRTTKQTNREVVQPEETEFPL
jgi:hypothetical protein